MGECICKLKRYANGNENETVFLRRSLFNFKRNAKTGEHLTRCPHCQWKSDTRNRLVLETSFTLELGSIQQAACTNPQEAVPFNPQKGRQKERLCLARTGSLTGKECFLVFRRFVCCGDLCLRFAASRATSPFTSPGTR